MQSGKRNEKNWLLEFDTLNTGISPLMGWESSKDTMSEVKLKFFTKEQAINYAKKYNIDYYIIEPEKRKIIQIIRFLFHLSIAYNPLIIYKMITSGRSAAW